MSKVIKACFSYDTNLLTTKKKGEENIIWALFGLKMCSLNLCLRVVSY